jgi:hypothetical protein
MALLDRAVRALWAALKYQGTFPTRGDLAAWSEHPATARVRRGVVRG